MMASVLCVTTLAADAPASNVVIRVSAQKMDGSIVLLDDYTNHKDGWEAAIDLAESAKTMKKNGYDRVVVDMYADWNAVNGEFTDDFFNGDGFNWDAILCPDDVRVTLNLNGHTINRGLTEYELNGEVMYIDEDADIIINDGTITGGWSYNGAGGIHVNDGAKLTLNNVNVTGNTVTNDQGGAIALYDGATLVMNGGSLSDNVLEYLLDHYEDTKGTLYVENSTAVLNDVVISGNRQIGHFTVKGSAVAMCGVSHVTLNGCTIENQGKNDEVCTTSLFYGEAQSELVLDDTVIRNNGMWYSSSEGFSTAIDMAGKLTMKECTVTGNDFFSIFHLPIQNAAYDIEDCTITDNKSEIFAYEPYGRNNTVTFTDCQFNNNFAQKYNKPTFENMVCREGLAAKITFVDCEFGDSTFDGKHKYTFMDSSDSDATGFILGEGSVAMIISLVSLVTSVTLIVVTVVSGKKKSPDSRTTASDE